MSAVPNAFNQGLAVAQGNIQLAGQNQQTKINAATQAANRAAQTGIEREKMAQQQQMQQTELKTQSENYARMNASHERIAAAENAQRQSQFDQTMAWNREQARVERLLSVKMKQIEIQQQQNEQEIAAMADNDPRLVEARSKRLALGAQMRNLEETMGASQTALGLAQGLKTDRLAEADARINAFHESRNTRRTAAENAFKTGLDYSILDDTHENSFWRNRDRIAADPGQLYPGQEGQHMTKVQTPNGVLYLRDQANEGDRLNAAMEIMYDNVMQWLGSEGDPNVARAKASDFQKNGAYMAAQVLHNALKLNGEAFGLNGAENDKAANLVAGIASKAAIIADLNKAHAGQSNPAGDKFKADIAKDLNELRKTGMGDEQISALFDGLGGMSQNRVELLNHYKPDDTTGKYQILDQSLSGVGRIHDVIHGVMDSNELMSSGGGQGKIIDHSKYDWVGVNKKARAAYGMGNSDQLTQLAMEMHRLGMTDQDVQALAQTLIESDPNLQTLRPEEIQRALQAQARQMGDYRAQMEAGGETERRLQGQIVAGGRLRGLGQTQDILSQLAGGFQ